MYLIKQGNAIIKFDGTEEYYSECCMCGDLNKLNKDEFFEEHLALYDTRLHCLECAKARTQREDF